MYTNNIPQNKTYKPQTYTNYDNYSYIDYNNYPSTTTYYGNDDRFGGFLAPFLLGGVGGYLIGRPNYNPGPIPVYFPPAPQPYPPYPYY